MKSSELQLMRFCDIARALIAIRTNESVIAQKITLKISGLGIIANICAIDKIQCLSNRDSRFSHLKNWHVAAVHEYHNTLHFQYGIQPANNRVLNCPEREPVGQFFAPNAKTCFTSKGI